MTTKTQVISCFTAIFNLNPTSDLLQKGGQYQTSRGFTLFQNYITTEVFILHDDSDSHAGFQNCVDFPHRHHCHFDLFFLPKCQQKSYKIRLHHC